MKKSTDTKADIEAQSSFMSWQKDTDSKYINKALFLTRITL